MTEATELNEIYKLDVIDVPTNRPTVRIDANDLRVHRFSVARVVEGAVLDRRRRRH